VPRIWETSNQSISRTVLINLPDTLWSILADPGQIEQILVNLAVNASDAGPTAASCASTPPT